jgi:hypothetical protein
MKKSITYTKVSSAILALLFPFMIGCSVVGGNSYSDDPLVRTQQEQVDRLKAELRDAERLAEEAKQREKAAINRLKAAEHELKARKSQAKGN